MRVPTGGSGIQGPPSRSRSQGLISTPGNWECTMSPVWVARVIEDLTRAILGGTVFPFSSCIKYFNFPGGLRLLKDGFRK